MIPQKLFLALCLLGTSVSGFTSFSALPRRSFQPQVRFSPSILVLGFQQPPPEAEAFLDNKEEEEGSEDELYEVEHMSLFLINRLGRVLVRQMRSQQEPIAAASATISPKALNETAKVEIPEKDETLDTAVEDPDLDTALPTDDVDAKVAVEVTSNDEVEEVSTSLHKREGDRNLGLKDEFVLPDETAQEDSLLEEKEEEVTPATADFLDLMAERKAKNAATSAASLYAFPTVISKEFGRPLPIIREGVPPFTKPILVEQKSTEEEGDPIGEDVSPVTEPGIVEQKSADEEGDPIGEAVPPVTKPDIVEEKSADEEATPVGEGVSPVRTPDIVEEKSADEDAAPSGEDIPPVSKPAIIDQKSADEDAASSGEDIPPAIVDQKSADEDAGPGGEDIPPVTTPAIVEEKSADEEAALIGEDVSPFTKPDIADQKSADEEEGVPPVTKPVLVDQNSADEEAALKSLESAKELLTNATKTAQDIKATIASARTAPSEEKATEAFVEKEKTEVVVDQGAEDMTESEPAAEDMVESTPDVADEMPIAENVIKAKREDAGLASKKSETSTNQTLTQTTEVPVQSINQRAKAAAPTMEVTPLEQSTTRPNPSPVDGKRNISEEAYSTLKNLGLIQPSPNPKDPDYNHSSDNEFAQENQILRD